MSNKAMQLQRCCIRMYIYEQEPDNHTPNYTHLNHLEQFAKWKMSQIFLKYMIRL